MVGCYFRRRKALAYGIAMSGSGIGTFVLAPVVQLLIELYSWRGALLILSAFVANLCVCGALLRPITLREVEEEEEQSAGEEKPGWYTTTGYTRQVFCSQAPHADLCIPPDRWHFSGQRGHCQTTKVGSHPLSAQRLFSTFDTTIRRTHPKAQRQETLLSILFPDQRGVRLPADARIPRPGCVLPAAGQRLQPSLHLPGALWPECRAWPSACRLPHVDPGSR